MVKALAGAAVALGLSAFVCGYFGVTWLMWFCIGGAVWAGGFMLALSVAKINGAEEDWTLPPLVALAALLLFAPSLASAADTTVDASSVANSVLDLVFAGLAGVVTWLLKRGVGLAERIHLMSASQIHDSNVDDMVFAAAHTIAAKIEAAIDPTLKLQISNGAIAEAAQLIVSAEPAAVLALGLTPEAVASKIRLALGDPLAPAVVAARPPTVASPVASAVATMGAAVGGAAGTLGAVGAMLLLLVMTGCTAAQLQAAETNIAAIKAKACNDHAAAEPVIAVGAALDPTIALADKWFSAACADPTKLDQDIATYVNGGTADLVAKSQAATAGHG